MRKILKRLLFACLALTIFVAGFFVGRRVTEGQQSIMTFAQVLDEVADKQSIKEMVDHLLESCDDDQIQSVIDYLTQWLQS